MFIQVICSCTRSRKQTSERHSLFKYGYTSVESLEIQIAERQVGLVKMRKKCVKFSMKRDDTQLTVSVQSMQTCLNQDLNTRQKLQNLCHVCLKGVTCDTLTDYVWRDSYFAIGYYKTSLMFSHKMGTRISSPGVKVATGLSLTPACRFCKGLGSWNINSTDHQTPVSSTHHRTQT